MKRRSEMKSKRINSTMIALAITVALCGSAFAQSAASQGASKTVNTKAQITYHDGPLMYGTSAVYFLWYGCWDETCRAGNTATQTIVSDFMSNLGGSPYFQIN